MGVLFFGPDFSAPSQLWMRRMADMVADDLSLLVDFGPLPEPYNLMCETLGLEKIGPNLPGPLDRIRKWYERRLHCRALDAAMERPDVHCAFVHFLVYAVRYRSVWNKTDKPVLVHCHGWDVMWELQRARPGITGRTNVHPSGYQEAVRALPPNVTLIANSSTTAESLEGVGVDPSRIVVKYIGVPCGDQPPSARQRGPDEPVTILFLGRLVDFKGPDLTVRAFARAREKGLQARLVIAGDGPLLPVCQELVRAFGLESWVDLVGAVSTEEGEALRSRAHLFTAHSQPGRSSGQTEALGVAFLEAMAAGLPVLTGCSGSLPEIVEHNEAGILFEPGDVEAHADALLTVGSDENRRFTMGKAAFRRVRRDFSLGAEEVKLRRLLGLREKQVNWL